MNTTTNATPRIVVVGRIEGRVKQTLIDGRYMDFCDRRTGSLLYIRHQPIEMCENDAQREGWLDEQEDDKGRAAYLRCLERENLPASWADEYMPMPAPDVEW